MSGPYRVVRVNPNYTYWRIAGPTEHTFMFADEHSAEVETKLLNAAYAAGRAARGGREADWQDIQSAPRDGSMFLAHYAAPAGPRVGAMQWLPKPTKDDPDAGRFHSWTMGTQSKFATHWMLLPSEPTRVLTPTEDREYQIAVEKLMKEPG